MEYSNYQRHIQLDWKSIGALKLSHSTERNLKDLLSKHAEVFKDELGTVQSMKVKLHLKPDARPKFCKPRSVPFALKPAIDRELERLSLQALSNGCPLVNGLRQ